MPEKISNTPVRHEYDPRHVARDGLVTVEVAGERVIVHDTNNLKELYEAFWRINQENELEASNPVQNAYVEELRSGKDGHRILYILQSLKSNPAYAELLHKLDDIAELRYQIQAARADGQTVEVDYSERDLWTYYHSKLFDVLVPEIQRLDSSLDPNLFCR